MGKCIYEYSKFMFVAVCMFAKALIACRQIRKNLVMVDFSGKEN